MPKKTLNKGQDTWESLLCSYYNLAVQHLYHFCEDLKNYNTNSFVKKERKTLGRTIKKMPVYEISFTIFNFILVNIAVDDNFLACWRLVFKKCLPKLGEMLQQNLLFLSKDLKWWFMKSAY